MISRCVARTTKRTVANLCSIRKTDITFTTICYFGKMLVEETTKTADGYTYSVEKYTFGNQKRAIVHGTWTGELDGLTFAGFYQGTIQNLLPIHTILGLSIKRVVEYNFRCSSGGGSLMILGTATITKRGDSVGANVQFAKSQAKNTCKLEWDMEVELQ